MNHFDLFARPFGISADGKWVVGTDKAGPYRWSSATGAQRLETPPGLPKDGFACSVSGDGSVVCGCYDDGRADPDKTESSAFGLPADSYQSCLWDHGRVRPLERRPSALWTVPIAISGNGAVIVGNSSNGGWRTPFLWTKSQGLKHLPAIRKLTATVEGISANGRVAFGVCTNTTTGESVATIWLDGKPLDVSSYCVAHGVRGVSGWKLERVSASSADGSVLTGQGTSPDGKATFWICH